MWSRLNIKDSWDREKNKSEKLGRGSAGCRIEMLLQLNFLINLSRLLCFHYFDLSRLSAVDQQFYQQWTTLGSWWKGIPFIILLMSTGQVYWTKASSIVCHDERSWAATFHQIPVTFKMSSVLRCFVWFVVAIHEHLLFPNSLLFPGYMTCLYCQ